MPGFDDIDGSNDVKEFLDRWAEECPEVRLESRLWDALKVKGFEHIRLRYEVNHHLWRFSFKLQNDRRWSSKEVERIMRAAFAASGHPIGKEFLAAVVEERRVRGGFVLLA